MEAIKSMMECLATKANAQMSGDIENTDTHEMGEVIDMIKDLSEAKYYCKITESMEEAKEEEETLKKAGIDTSMLASRYYNDYRYQNGQYAPSPMRNSMPRYMMDGRRGYAMPYYPDEYDPANEFYMNKWRLGTKPRFYDGGNGGYSSGGSGNSSGNYSGGSRGYSDGGSNSSSGMSSTGGMSDYNSGSRGYGDDGYYREPYPKMTESRYDRARRGYSESKEQHKGNSQEDVNARKQSLEEYAKEIMSDVTDMVKDASPDERAAMKTKLATLASKI